MQPLTAWSPGFSRSKPFEPPKGGTPNQPGFMESPLSLFRVHWDHEPIRIPLSRPSATLSPAQSGGEGRERGRFNGERASSALRLCLGAMNPLVLVLVLVLEDNSPNRGRGRAGRRGGNGGSWKASFGPASVSGSRRSIGVGSNCSPRFSWLWLFFCSAVAGPVCP